MNRRASIAVAVAIALIVAAVAAAGRLHAGSTGGAQTGAKPVALDVPLAQAALRSYVTHVHAQGRVGSPAGGEAKLAFPEAGIVARVDVHVGDVVSAGEPLMHLDTGGFVLDAAQARSDAAAAAATYGGGSVPERALAGARARLAAAQDRLHALEMGAGSAQSDSAAALAAVRQSEAKLDADRRALDRAQALYAGGVVALKDVEAARAQLDFDRADADANRAKAASAGANVGASLTQARADVAQAQSDVRSAQAQLAVTGAQAASAQSRFAAAQRTLALATLQAMADGVVTAILKQPGEAVDPTQPAIVVGPPSSSTVTLAVTGDDARAVAIGDPVTVASALRGTTAHGRVRRVLRSVDPTTQSSTVVVDGIPPGAASGEAVEATISAGERRGIVIPTAAIIEDPQTGNMIVFVRERSADGSEKFVSREIAVAGSDDVHTLVAGGLRSGERIAAQGAFDLLAAGGGE